MTIFIHPFSVKDPITNGTRLGSTQESNRRRLKRLYDRSARCVENSATSARHEHFYLFIYPANLLVHFFPSESVCSAHSANVDRRNLLTLYLLREGQRKARKESNIYRLWRSIERIKIPSVDVSRLFLSLFCPSLWRSFHSFSRLSFSPDYPPKFAKICSSTASR